MKGPTVKVLSIIGCTRSGSTLLDNILGELDGFFSGGEICYLWDRGLVQGRLCGCLRPFKDCESWSAILARAFGDCPPRFEDVAAWRDDKVRTRHTWKLLNGTFKQLASDRQLAAYVEVTSRLYRAIAEVTTARIIVDSSKRPCDAAILRLMPNVEPYFVHLVRDPRGVVHSWHRRKRQLDDPRGQEMYRQTTGRTILKWLWQNLASEAVCQKETSRALRLRYEDFMSQPQKTISRILTLVDEKPSTLPFADIRTVRLGGNHSVSGNPNRFKTGLVRLQEDVEWQTKLGLWERYLTAVVSLPLMKRYGYELQPRRETPASAPEE